MSADANSAALARRDWLLGAVGSLGLLAGARAASAAGSEPAHVPKPRGAPASAATPSKPRIGLALGGGSARGFAHIGVLKSLDQAGIKPNVVAGTSAGALVGAFYAAGWTPWQIEEFFLQVRESDVADFSAAGKRGLLTGDALATLVQARLKGALIESLPIPFAAIATDLKTGEMQMLRTGPVADAVRASCSLPGIFVPKTVDGRELVDGGLVSPLPVGAARRMGCDIVIAVDVSAQPQPSDLSGLYEVILQSFDIMGRALSNQEALQADLLIRPETAPYSSSNFNVRRELIQAGYVAAQGRLADVRAKISAHTR